MPPDPPLPASESRREVARETERVTLGVLADTHGWVHPFLHEAFSGVRAILHVGDVGHPDVLVELGTIAPTLAVRGNVDGGELLDLPEERVERFAGRRIAMRHIAGSPKRPAPEVRALLTRARPHVFLCGHSHIPAVDRVLGALWCNPGAAGRHGFHRDRTALLLHLDPDLETRLDLVKLGPRTAPG